MSTASAMIGKRAAWRYRFGIIHLLVPASVPVIFLLLAHDFLCLCKKSSIGRLIDGLIAWFNTSLAGDCLKLLRVCIVRNFL